MTEHRALQELNKKYNWGEIFTRTAHLESALTDVRRETKETKELRREFASFSRLAQAKKELEDVESKLCEISLLEKEEDFAELCAAEKEVFLAKEKELVSAIESLIYREEKVERHAVFIEIRAGAGGGEASLFVADVARMYTMYAQRKGWKTSIVSTSETGVGGLREIVLFIEGKNVFHYFSFESGVHRVQRVPVTESAGRVHTSTITVAVLPEVDDVEVAIDEKDLRIDTYRAGGAGGQHVNKTDSAVRITHMPSGIVVQCQDERSQHKNKAKAMKALQAKLFAAEEERQKKELSQKRKEMVSNADRSEKIRTYNYPQNRVTDHRASLTYNQLEFIIDGNLDIVLDGLLEKLAQEKVISPYFLPFVIDN
jgi:peptide chain release factor 1